MNIDTTLNISNDINNSDPFFRYKMPKVTLKHEGKGNGVKTVVSNIKDVSKSLNRNVGDLLAFIATELSVCSLQRKDDYIINGTFDTQTVQNIIAKFVTSHVLCDVCGNPETVFVSNACSKKEASLYKVCQACGGRSKVKHHKINKRIKNTIQQDKTS